MKNPNKTYAISQYKYGKTAIFQLLAFLLFFSTVSVLRGQQVQQFSQYQQLRYMINPAATGADDHTLLYTGFRKQWWGFGYEPTSIYAGLNQSKSPQKRPEKTPLALRTSQADAFHHDPQNSKSSSLKHGFGLSFLNDAYGAFNSSNINMYYALHKKLGSDLHISGGISLGYKNINFDESRAIPEIIQDNLYQQFANNSSVTSSIDLNTGIQLYSKSFYIGYSSNQLLSNRISFKAAIPGYLVAHHNLLGGYTMKVNNSLILTPNFHYKMTENSPNTLDVNIYSEYQKKYFGSVGIRNQDAVVLMAGLFLNQKWSLSYSYDANTSQLRKTSSGGHEIYLALKL